MRKARGNTDDPCIYLDLNEVELQGWESEKSAKLVDAIIQWIEHGDNFPPVPVHKIDENTYHLSPLRETHDRMCDGGHCRALAHYITNRALKCVLVYGEPPVPPDWSISVWDIKIVDDTGQYAEHKERFPNYR